MQVVRSREVGFYKLWNSLLDAGGGANALYGNANLAYYKEYCNSSENEDISFLIVDKNVPVCGVRAISSKFDNGGIEISCFGLPLLYIEVLTIEKASLHSARRILRNEFRGILSNMPEGTFVNYRDFLRGGSLSPVGRLLLDCGGVEVSSFSQVIDLSQPEKEMHRHLTKAYKWAVNWGMKNLDLEVLDVASITPAHMPQFKSLHLEAAGRATRTSESWNLQHAMVASGEAFCVFAWMDEVLVSAALFPHSSSHCVYGVSASKRDLFDKPLSHSVIWTALLHAKKSGMRYFEMGNIIFPASKYSTSLQKELGISFFKRAFGGETQVSIDVRLKLNNDTKMLMQK
jgi:hypothetical protein